VGTIFTFGSDILVRALAVVRCVFTWWLCVFAWWFAGMLALLWLRSWW
jgi:hypothetical protein